jgi:Na+-transporting methylmalonyl-CoA/oxaloacetate decarboxylase gamma subunit
MFTVNHPINVREAMMPEEIRNNPTIWIAGIVAVVFIFLILACVVIYTITLVNTPEESLESSIRLMFPA